MPVQYANGVTETIPNASNPPTVHGKNEKSCLLLEGIRNMAPRVFQRSQYLLLRTTASTYLYVQYVCGILRLARVERVPTNLVEVGENRTPFGSPRAFGEQKSRERKEEKKTPSHANVQKNVTVPHVSPLAFPFPSRCS